MEHSKKQKPAKEKPRGRPFTGMRDVTDHRETPANPEPRIAPKNRSEVVHTGSQVMVTNRNRQTRQYDLSVAPSSHGAHVIDKALGIGMNRLQADAERRGETYNATAEGVTGIDSAIADMRSEMRAASYEMRPAKPVLFGSKSVGVILLGLHEMVERGERVAARPATPGADDPARTVALQELREAQGLLHDIDLQIDPEAGYTSEPPQAYLGNVAVTAATVELPGQMAKRDTRVE